jgi:glycosyltransferase involved in cell wall biosynthesis
MRVLLAGGLRQKGEHSMLDFVGRLTSALINAKVDAVPVHAEPLPWAADMPPKLKKYANYLETYLRYPKRLRKMARDFDLVHVTDQGNAHLLKELPVPAVVTIHDLMAVRAALGEFDYWQVSSSGQAQQRIVRESLSLAARAACVSTKTQSDLERLVPDLKSQVIHNALYSDFRDKRQAKREPFFFCIGGNQPYKNRAGITQVAGDLLKQPGFESHRFKLVGKDIDDEIDAVIKASGIAARIDLIVDPSHDKVGAIYGSAEGLLFLSRDEGFGLPILEAQSAGCWAMTTDKEPMREVAGDGATLVPEGREADAIAAAYADRNTVIARGDQNLKRFSVERMAREYVQFYKEASA